MAMEHPRVIKAIDTPSTLHKNLSLSMIGVKIAVIMIQKHEVDAMSIILPKLRAATFHP